MSAFLSCLSGNKTWVKLMEEHPKKTHRRLLGELRRLERVGVVIDTARVSPLGSRVPRTPDEIENISVNVTRRCNLRCSFCYALPQLRTDSNEEISSEEIIKYLESMRSLLSKNFSLTLLGGEPLLFPDKVLSLARLAQRRKWQCLVSTNGHLITDEFARLARKANLQIQVSLDGSTEDINAIVRGAGAFGKTVAGVRRLVTAKAHTILSLVCHQGNVRSLADYYKLGMDLGVNEVRFIPLKLVGGGRRGELKPVSLSRLFAETDALFKSHPEFKKLAGRDCFSICAAVCKMSAHKASCGTGKQTLLLDADGSLYPCLNMHTPDLRLGNIRDQRFSFSQLWENSTVINRVRTESSVQDSPCRNCAVWHWCLGGCHGETLSVKGRLTGRAWNCPDQKKAIIEMFWRLAG